MLEEGENGAATLKSRVADTGDLELLGGGDAPEVESLKSRVGKEEAAIE